MILVSGATGFLGTHLLKRLCESNSAPIRALYRDEDKKTYTLTFLNLFCSSTAKTNIAKIEWVKANILDIPELEIAFKDIHYVYHCAAWVGNSPSQSKEMRKVNIEGTANMVNLAIAHQVKKFCHVSSTAALGQYPNSNVVDEKAPRESERHSSIYSISKYGAEMEVWRASQEGLDVVIVNPGVIIGHGFFENSSGQLFKKILDNTKFYISKQTGFVYVDDVVEFMLKLIQSDITNESYILVAENLTFKSVMNHIASTFQKPKPSIKAQKWMLYIVWFFQQIKSLFSKLEIQITLNSIKKINSITVYQSDKSKNEFSFVYTPIEKSIDLIYKDYKTTQNKLDQ
jgi:nucleoside-diphosphate-sugar epimerase